MGHAKVENLDLLIMKVIYNKGKISIEELVELAQKRGEAVHADEGDYTDRNMLSMIFEICIKWHSRQSNDKTEGIVLEPILTNENEEFMFDQWINDNLTLDETENNTAFMNLKWKFAKNGRHKYIKKEINVLCEYGN